MPLWIAYTAEYVIAIALVVIALILAAWAFGYVHLVAVDEEICGALTTHYLVAIGDRKEARLAAIKWVVQRQAERNAGYRLLLEEIDKLEKEGEKHG